MTEYNEWKEYFDNNAPNYKDEIFVKNTKAEIKFLVEEFGLPNGSAILDMGCGIGRHSIGLAQHGYRITGVDWSEGMLKQARLNEKVAAVEVNWVCQDAKVYCEPNAFDGAICLCEGAFGLLLKDEDPIEHDYAILRNLYDSLKSGAKLILGGLSGLRKIRDAKQEDIESGRFDPFTLVETFTLSYKLEDGGKQRLTLHEHGFLPGELVALVRKVGFEVKHVWSGTAGSWQRTMFDIDDVELMVVAVKP